MLVLLADTRKKLLWLWLGFTALLALLLFVQTILGKYEGMESQTWTWAFAHLLPALALLFAAVLLNRNPSKVLARATFWMVFGAALAYLLLVTATLLTLPFATIHWTIEAYLARSYTWLMPFQLLLLPAFAILYFRKEPLFRPNAAILQQYVSKKLEFAQRSGNAAQVQAFEALVTGDTGLSDALESLRSQLKTDANDIVILQNQYTAWLQQRDLNLLPPDALQRELNRLTLATIGYIEKL